jgi:hypothetical protein
VDGTLTTNGLLQSATVRALEVIRKAGIRVVLVSGRPSGWGECWMRTLPVDGVIVENGGLYYTRREGAVVRVYAQAEAERNESRAQLGRDVRAVLRKIPGAQLSSDSAFTEVDLAIDYNEEARLGSEAAGRIESALRERGAQAVRSSVHVNCWRGSFNKLSMVREFCHRELGLRLKKDDDRACYVGDSFNDAPLFGAMSLSIGVANVRAALATIDAPPAFITRKAEGDGFRELAAQLVRSQGNR